MNAGRVIGKISAIFSAILSKFTVANGIRAASCVFFLIFIRVVCKIASKALDRVQNREKFPVDICIFQKILKYACNILSALYVLWFFGVNIGTLIGAAGIAGVAVSLAAQTSFSNIISGFFVISDRSFKIGDAIQIGDISGTVETISMMSTKLRTFDGQLVRIPNETVINSNLINFSDGDARRFSMKVRLPFDANLAEAKRILTEAANSCDLILQNPAPIVHFDEFAERHVKANLIVWSKRENFWEMRDQLFVALGEKCREGLIDATFSIQNVSLVRD